MLNWLWLVIPGYIMANLYIIQRSLHWFSCLTTNIYYSVFRIIFPSIYGISAMVMVVAFFLPEGPIHRVLQKFSNYFLGTFFCLICIYLALDLVRLIVKHSKLLSNHQLTHPGLLALIALIAVSFTLLISLYGFHHANVIYVNKYDIQVPKDGGALSDLRVVLIADTHLGYSIGSRQMKEMAKKVNAQHPDIILFAGDIFDNTTSGLDDSKSIKESLSSMKSTYGTYACWGNHDIDERLFNGFSVTKKSDERRSPEMDQFLADCNIHAMNDETLFLADSFYLIGRKDASKTGDGTKRASLSSLMNGVDQTKPVLVMDHEPKKLQETADAGTDIMLSGHTHDGQFFPMNLSCKLVWENPVGLLKKDNMYSIVTAGVGIYGPAMRVGTNADITVVDVHFN